MENKKKPIKQPSKDELSAKKINSSTIKLMTGEKMEVNSDDDMNEITPIHSSVEKMQSGPLRPKLSKREEKFFENIEQVKKEAYTIDDTLIVLSNKMEQKAQEEEELHKKSLEDRKKIQKEIEKNILFKESDIELLHDKASKIYDFKPSNVKTLSKKSKSNDPVNVSVDLAENIYSISKGRYYKFTTESQKVKKQSSSIPKNLELNSESSRFFAIRMGWIEDDTPGKKTIPNTTSEQMNEDYIEKQKAETQMTKNNSVEKQLFQKRRGAPKLAKIKIPKREDLLVREPVVENKPVDKPKVVKPITKTKIIEKPKPAQIIKEPEKQIKINSNATKENNDANNSRDKISKIYQQIIESSQTVSSLKKLNSAESPTTELNKISSLVLEENHKKNNIKKNKKGVKK